MNRRDVLGGIVGGGVVLAAHSAAALAAAPHKTAVQKLAELEAHQGGRLGVAVLDSQTGRRLGHREDERFPICSTFKLLLVAAVLQRVGDGKESLDRRITYGKDAVLDWAPVTRLNVGGPGLSIAQLCQAAILMSDNTAANLLLDSLGGPSAITRYARQLGDAKTRLDHREPLGADPGSVEDSTTPQNMLADMQHILLGDALPKSLRTRLERWLMFSQTGAQDLRLGLPASWHVGDKTGGARQANNDIAIARPPKAKPLLITVYYVNSDVDAAARKAVLADVGRVVAAWYAA